MSMLSDSGTASEKKVVQLTLREGIFHPIQRQQRQCHRLAYQKQVAMGKRNVEAMS